MGNVASIVSNNKASSRCGFGKKVPSPFYQIVNVGIQTRSRRFENEAKVLITPNFLTEPIMQISGYVYSGKINGYRQFKNDDSSLFLKMTQINDKITVQDFTIADWMNLHQTQA